MFCIVTLTDNNGLHLQLLTVVHCQRAGWVPSCASKARRGIVVFTLAVCSGKDMFVRLCVLHFIRFHLAALPVLQKCLQVQPKLVLSLFLSFLVTPTHRCDRIMTFLANIHGWKVFRSSLPSAETSSSSRICPVLLKSSTLEKHEVVYFSRNSVLRLTKMLWQIPLQVVLAQRS